ncbi:PQQ-dependent sugar dehydrogenase [bacterium]|nr:PQQ-dependent sugar dehydrogenase [bacterium]
MSSPSRSHSRGAARTARASAAVSVAVAITLSGAALAGEPAMLPDGFAIEQVGWGPFDAPVGFALLPDGRVLILEQASGKVRLNAVGATSSVVIHTIPDLNTTGGEQGLLGVAVDPGWPTRPYVYFYYDHAGGTIHVTMFEAQGDLTDPSGTSVTLASPYHLLIDLPDASILHQAGTLRFGPDGMLYVSVGDDGNPCNAQDLSVLAGGILRLDVSGMPGAGSGPPPKSAITPSGNPFGGPGDNERLFWAWGLRNPYRFTIDPASGDLFLGDVGRHDYEEMNHIPYAGGGGENFGWPQREGPIDPELGFLCGIGNTFTDPILAYPRSVGITVIGGPLYRMPGAPSPLAFPAEYDGSLFLIDFWGGWWQRYVEGGSGWELAPAAPGQPSADHWAEGLHYCSDAQLGPDGAIYYTRLITTANVAGVFRIVSTTASGVVATEPVLPIAVAPNPARLAQETHFRWSSRRPGAHRLTIRNVAGRVVRSLRTSGPAGAQSAAWDGTGADGRPVAAGVYLFELETADGERRSGKVSRIH